MSKADFLRHTPTDKASNAAAVGQKNEANARSFRVLAPLISHHLSTRKCCRNYHFSDRPFHLLLLLRSAFPRYPFATNAATPRISMSA